MDKSSSLENLKLCSRTYNLTRDYHKLVDSHLFVKNIEYGSEEAEFYIYMIYKVLIILETKLNSVIPDDLNVSRKEFLECYKYRDSSHSLSSLDKLLSKISVDTLNRTLYLSEVYLWYLSLMSGGRILKQHFPQYSCLFTFFKETKTQLKKYIDSQNINEQLFIDNVAIGYSLITSVFDEFYEKK